jgi:hypothetical protein
VRSVRASDHLRLGPVRAFWGQVPAVIVAVQRSVLRVDIEPLRISSPTPVVEREDASVPSTAVVALSIARRS